MKRRFILLVIGLVLLLSSLPVFALNPQPEPPSPAGSASILKVGPLVLIPDSIKSNLRLRMTNKNFDQAFMEADKLTASPATQGEMQAMLQKLSSAKTVFPVKNQTKIQSLLDKFKTPQSASTAAGQEELKGVADWLSDIPALDFSQFITYTQNQDHWGGCVGRSMINAMNIMNEAECPYTPDLSFWYMDCRQNQLAVNGQVDTKSLFENNGVCSELSLPSDYDKATLLPNNTMDYSTMPQPTMQNFCDVEAAYYKVNLLSDAKFLDVNVMKSFMFAYGPLLIEGPFYDVQGPNPTEWHCMTVVGWDDSRQAFKILNSWGDHWNGNGFFWLRYEDLWANAHDFRYFIDGPSDRTNSAYATSGRINLQGDSQAFRNNLTITCGVTGDKSRVIWDQPNKKYCVDNSQNLCYDFPLLYLATKHWPPSPNNQYYIEVTNHGTGAFTLKEFTLARQYRNQYGALAAETYSSNAAGQVVGPGKTVTFYLPIKTIGNIPKGIITPHIPLTTVLSAK